MDRLMRLIIRQKGQLIIDDKHKDYLAGEEYKVEKETLENGVIITKYYKHEIDHTGLQPL